MPDSPAHAVLARLLLRAQSSLARGEAATTRITMQSPRDAKEYLALKQWSQREAFHGQIEDARRLGAIRVDYHRLHADGDTLKTLHVADLDALAALLGVKTWTQSADEADALLRDWYPQFPVLREVVEAWRRGKPVRRRMASSAVDLSDAAHAVAVRMHDHGPERLLRRESTRLFGPRQSKRLEGLTEWLDLLIHSELDPSGLDDPDIWSSLGLRRVPQPMLIAGSGEVRLEDGTTLPLIAPYLGLPMEVVRSVHSVPAYLLSIENLTSFHEAVHLLNQQCDGLVLYTAGMPSPAWRALYGRILDALPAQTGLYHWGDIDVGGFRIANRIARTARAHGRTLQPWLMEPTGAGEPTTAALGSAMCRHAQAAGWRAIADALRDRPELCEQEAVRPQLPKVTVPAL